MECPKCGVEIDSNTLVCPNCKKVLKIICPTCRTINSKNICKNCGEILASKCVKCGKINLTRNKNCVKCGYPTAYSALQGESLTDEFAVIKIEFPNSDVVKAKLGSNKLYTKFKNNFDQMIVKYIHSLGLRRQILKGEVYVIRFNRTYTFASSARDAIKAVIELANMFARLNIKLLNRINTVLKCNITIMKKEATLDPSDINTGFRANMLSQGNEVASKALDSIQIITDDDFYELYNLDYKLEGLDSAPVNGIMKRFYEIDLKKYINVEEFIEEDSSDQDDVEEIPNFVQTEVEQKNELDKNQNRVTDEELYNIELINFEEVNCTFYSTENIAVIDKVKEVFQNVPKGITAIKGSDIYQPYTLKLLSVVNSLGLYENIIPITCYDDMKYSPYSFFRELISTIFEYCVSQKLFEENDFSMFEATNSVEFVRDLINLNQRDMNDIYESRNKYFQVFLDIFNAIPNTLIYIENFEKIDDSSLFIIEQLFEHFNDLNVSYLISYDKDFSLHKNAHFLLTTPFYTEINLVPASFNNIVLENPNYYKNVLSDFYFKKLEKYANGSMLFLDYAIQYLIESGIYRINKDGSLVLKNTKTVIIPSTVGRLIQRRLNLIKNKNIIKFLTMCVLIGTRIDMKTAQLFGFENWQEIINKLSEHGFIYIYNDCIYFPNYNLLKNNLLSIMRHEDLFEIANELLENVYLENMYNPVKAYLYDVVGSHEKVIFEWEKLANTNLSMGDFSSYINCSEKILHSLNKYAQDWTKEDLEQYKNTLYENISANMLDYNPERSREIAQQTLNNLKDNKDKIKFVQFCIKMIQGSCAHGEFISALNITHKILSLMGDVSINPDMANFDFNYLYISLLHIKILFNIGEYNNCINLGYNILNVLDSKKINNLNIDQAFKNDVTYLILEDITCIALANIIALKDDVEEFLKITGTLFNFIPKEFGILIQLQNLIRGQKVQIDENTERKNLISDIIFHVIKAFTSYNENPQDFAREIYKVKISAKYSYLTNFELFSDLMIGYSYIKLKSYKKAYSIISRVEKSAKEKGLLAIVHLSYCLLSLLNIKQKKFDIAYGILSNSDIQMEKNPVSEYFVLLNKVNMYIVLMCQNNEKQANICLNQAKYIIQKYNLNFDLNIDISKILMEN